MEILISPQAWLIAGGIFFLRVANMSLDTLRVMVMMRGRKWSAWVLGFIQTVVFVVALTSVIKDLTNMLNMIAYAAGFATGNVVGMWMEERLAIGHVHLRIISPSHGEAIADRLREEGYAVTEIPARGRDGEVTLLNASVLRKNAKKALEFVQDEDPDAFVTAEDLRPVSRGFWRT